MKKKAVVGIVVAVIAVVAIGAGIAYAQSVEQQRVNQEREQAAQSAYEGYVIQLNGIKDKSGEDRAALEGKLKDLESLRKAVEDGKDGLALPDGGYQGYDELMTSIERESASIRNLVTASFKSDCEKAVSNATVEGATKDTIAASKAILQTLLDEATAVKQGGIWESDEAFNAFEAEVKTGIQKCDAKTAELEAAEKAAEEAKVAEEQAAAQAAQSASVGTNNNGSSGYDSGYSYSGGNSYSDSGSSSSGGSSSGGGYWWDLSTGHVPGHEQGDKPKYIDENGNPVW